MTTRAPDPFLHAVSALAFGDVLEFIASRCVGDGAKKEILALAPSADIHAIQKSVRLIDELRAFRAIHGDIPVADTSYAPRVEALVASRQQLSPEGLLEVAAGERTAADLHRVLSGVNADYPLLSGAVSVISPDRSLAAAIEDAIDPDGNVKDSASPELKRVRRAIHGARAKLRSLSEKLLGSYGDDALSTVLGSRHVLVVPRARVSRGDGMVHSASASGGSLYFEPIRLVEMNNDLEALVADERAEVARILADLNERVRVSGDRILVNASAVTRLDALRARAVFCQAIDATTPKLAASGELRLVRARHPRLAHVLGRTGGEETLVPLDIALEPAGRLMVITGPNAGGKTVALSTLGICTLMFQSGLQVPCGEGTVLPVFDSIFVDIGDEQSIESSLSTFTSHLHNLDEMVRTATEASLCLIDEIGDGTDPDEGAALAIATLERLLASGAAVIATTHYGRIKTFALATPGVSNASMAFDETDGMPLYTLLQGIAGRSRGIETAQRTGFDPDVVGRAREHVGEETYRLESILSRLEAEKLAFEREREGLAARRAELETRMTEADEKMAAYTMTRNEAQRRALREAEALLIRARREAEQVVRSIREKKADRRSIRDGREQIQKRLDDIHRRMAAEPSATSRLLETVTVGERVSISPTGRPAGSVVSVENGRAVIEINDKRITIPVARLYAPAGPDTPARSQSPAFDVEIEPLTSTTLDVRGHDREDALSEVGRFLDRAAVVGVQEIKIIHGIGEGILSRAVRDYLLGDPRVASTRVGEQVEGGAGVTFVQFDES